MNRGYIYLQLKGYIYGHEINPESFNGEEKTSDYIKITLNTTLNSTNITDFENLGLTDFI